MKTGFPGQVSDVSWLHGHAPPIADSCLQMFKDKQPETGQTFNDKQPKRAKCSLMCLHFFERFASEFTVYNENAAENLPLGDIFLQRILPDFAKYAAKAHNLSAIDGLH